MPFVKEIMIKFPNVQIITNPDVASLLGNEHIIAKTTGNEFINLAAVQHEKIFFGDIWFYYKKKYLHKLKKLISFYGSE